VGGWVGEKVAEFAGSKVGAAIRKGAEAVKTAARTVVSTVTSAAKSVFHAVTFGLFS